MSRTKSAKHWETTWGRVRNRNKEKREPPRATPLVVSATKPNTRMIRVLDAVEKALRRAITSTFGFPLNGIRCRSEQKMRGDTRKNLRTIRSLGFGLSY